MPVMSKVDEKRNIPEEMHRFDADNRFWYIGGLSDEKISLIKFWLDLENVFGY